MYTDVSETPASVFGPEGTTDINTDGASCTETLVPLYQATRRRISDKNIIEV
jgi:hypothetical protein